ncbi:MAG TPA: lysine exporter LysO family protein [Prolixibacteraceae bacterium]|nr:lysine exporter LysO family protein [Prolixibacteraceae bacterium]
MKNSIIILLLFSLGILLGINGKLPDVMMETDFSIIALYCLMFLVGVGIGADRKSWSVIHKMKLKIFLVPLGIIVGTLAGAAIASLLLPEMKLKEVLAVGSGFGYYSLSSLLITEMAGESLGVIALLSNIMREMFTLLATPLLVMYFGKLAGISAGGATSMDTTLPVITRFSGKEWSIISVFSGIVLTLLVPFLVTLVLKYF